MEENTKKEEIYEPVRNNETSYVKVVSGISATPRQEKKLSKVASTIRQTIIWFNIFMASICTFIMLINIWLDGGLTEALGKSWATFLVVGIFSVFIYAMIPLLDRE